MKNLFYIISFLLLLPLMGKGQDIIHFENGDSLKAKVFSVKPGKVGYIESGNPELVVHEEKVKKISHIEFNNQTKKVRPLNKGVATPYISINPITSAFPIGSYGALDGGQARTGIAPSIEGAVFFGKHIGVTINVGGFNNSVRNKYIDAFRDGISDQPPASGGGEFAQFDADPWDGTFFLLGPTYSLKFKQLHRFTFDIRFLLGGLSSRPPYYAYSYYNSFTGDLTIIEVRSVNYNTDPALGTGINVRYDISQRFAVNLLVQFIASNQNVRFTEYKRSEDGGTGTTEEEWRDISYKLPVTFINTGIGITYDFARKKHK